MTRIGTTVWFAAAHRQYGDPSPCGRLHGHNWKVEIEIVGEPDDIGYVVDFKDIKETIMSWDHAVLLHRDDPLCDVLEQANQRVVRLPTNPTCEHLADHLARHILETRSERIDVIYITVWENERSWARVVMCNL